MASNGGFDHGAAIFQEWQSPYQDPDAFQHFDFVQQPHEQMGIQNGQASMNFNPPQGADGQTMFNTPQSSNAPNDFHAHHNHLQQQQAARPPFNPTALQTQGAAGLVFDAKAPETQGRVGPVFNPVAPTTCAQTQYGSPDLIDPSLIHNDFMNNTPQGLRTNNTSFDNDYFRNVTTQGLHPVRMSQASSDETQSMASQLLPNATASASMSVLTHAQLRPEHCAICDLPMMAAAEDVEGVGCACGHYSSNVGEDRRYSSSLVNDGMDFIHGDEEVEGNTDDEDEDEGEEEMDDEGEIDQEGASEDEEEDGDRQSGASSDEKSDEEADEEEDSKDGGARGVGSDGEDGELEGLGPFGQTHKSVADADAYFAKVKQVITVKDDDIDDVKKDQAYWAKRLYKAMVRLPKEPMDTDVKMLKTITGKYVISRRKKVGGKMKTFKVLDQGHYEASSWRVVGRVIQLHDKGSELIAGYQMDGKKGIEQHKATVRLGKLAKMFFNYKNTVKDVLDGQKFHMVVDTPDKRLGRARSSKTGNTRKAQNARGLRAFKAQMEAAKGTQEDVSTEGGTDVNGGGNEQQIEDDKKAEGKRGVKRCREDPGEWEKKEELSEDEAVSDTTDRSATKSQGRASKVGKTKGSRTKRTRIDAGAESSTSSEGADSLLDNTPAQEPRSTSRYIFTGGKKPVASKGVTPSQGGTEPKPSSAGSNSVIPPPKAPPGGGSKKSRYK